MVISRTSTVEVIIQALSPLLTVGSCASAEVASMPRKSAASPARYGKFNFIFLLLSVR